MDYNVYSGRTTSGIVLDSTDSFMYVSRGGTANSTTVNYSGCLYVFSGGMVNRTTVNAGGSMTIYNGGSANNTTVNSNGYMYVSRGGIANNITMSSGQLYVYGGMVNNTTISGNDYMGVSSGGTANNTRLIGGRLVAFSGTVNNTIIGGMGTFIIYSGIASNTTLLGPDCVMAVSAGGVADQIAMFRGGLIVASGGTANITFSPWHGGSVTSLFGAKITYLERDANVYYGAGEIISKGNSFENLTVTGGRSAVVYSNGFVNSTTISSGILTILSGGTANNTIVESGCRMVLSGGGTVNDTVVSSGGTMCVNSGTTIAGSQIYGGNVYFYRETEARDADIIFALDQRTSSDDYIVNNLAYLNAKSFAITITANQGGGAYKLAEGADGFNKSVTIRNVSGGYSSAISIGETILFNEKNYTLDLTNSQLCLIVSENKTGIRTYAGSNLVSSADIMTNKIIASLGEEDTIYVYSGGIASSITISRGGSMVINDGGTVNSTTVNEYGNLYVHSGGTANSTIVNDGGDLFVFCGGRADNTTVNSGGDLFVSSGGRADNAFINPFGELLVRAGGTATNITAATGANLRLTVAPDTYIQGTYDGSSFEIRDAMISGYAVDTVDGRLRISSGGTADRTTVNNGMQVVESGGTAMRTTVNSGGELYVASGGTASSVMNRAGGRLVVESGGTASIVFNPWENGAVTSDDGAAVTYLERDANVYYGGDVAGLVSKGNVLSGLTIEDGYSAIVYAGGTATGATVNSGGRLWIDSLGSAAGATVNMSGVLIVSNGGSANGAVVNSGGSLSIKHGGMAANIVENGGYVHVHEGTTVNFTANTFNGLTLANDSATVHSGTTANSAAINADGYLYVYSGGTVTGATVNYDGRIYLSGGTADNTIVNSFGALKVYEGGTADRTVVCSRGNLCAYGGIVSRTTVNVSGYLIAESGGAANGTTVSSGGSLRVLEGSTAESNYINFSGALRVYEGGSARHTAVSSGGSVYVSDGGRHGGTLQIADGGIVDVDKGGIIDFTVAGRTTGAGYMINDLSRITGSPTFSITVSAGQAVGTYKLAQGAAAFTRTISIGTAETQYGSLTVNGAILEYDSKYYDLLKNNGDLSLRIRTDITPPSKPTVAASTTAATNKNVTLTATFSSDTTKKQYSTDNATWKTYSSAVAVAANGTYYFRGIDTAGNISAVKSYTVKNIDKTAPSKPTVSASTTAATNKNITLTVTFSSDTTKKQYSTDNTTWKTYSSAVAVAANGTYYFRGIDAAGNISSVAAYKVTNIDKTAPAAPTAKADITKVTNQNVTLTAAYSADTVTKQYSLDNSTWKTYSSGVTMKKNGTAYFRGIDAAGNISNVAYLKVKNIDKTAPRKPKVTASTMDPTNQNVTLTAAYSADTVTKQYSLDNSKWKSYKAAGVTLKENGVVYFRGIDEAGNISVVKRRKVKNIDKVAPAKPTLASVSTTAMTNGSVTLTATFSSDSSKKQYSLDKETWKSYKSAGVTLKSNGTVYFRSIDAAGNISKVASQKVSNICPKGDFTNDTVAAAGEKKALKLSSAQKITGWVGLGDPKDFIKLEVQKKGQVSLDMNAKTASAQKGGEVKLSLLNSAGKAVALSALDSDTLATKSKLAAGIYYLGISCADVKKYSTSYTVTAGMLAAS